MNVLPQEFFVLPAIGRPDPLANALKTGTADDCPRVPEDAFAVNARAAEWYMSLRPQNLYHAWLVDQVAITSLRIDREGRVERRLRDRVVLRAELFWDDDRSLEAEELGDQLASAPSKVVNKLRRTPQGCDWMIARWARLARVADLAGSWDDAQTSLAFDLLGTRPDERIGRPGEAIDAEGRPIEPQESLAALARREVAGLQKRKEQVAPLDALDRTMTRADYADQACPQLREARRRAAALHRQMKWYLAQIYFKNPHIDITADAFRYFQRDIGLVPAPEEMTEELPPEAEIEPETETEIEPDPDPVPFPDRREAKLRKAEGRNEARRRKLERLRA